MSTIFPREEKAEQIFDEILKNPRACERLKDTFFAAIPSAEESEGAGTNIPDYRMYMADGFRESHAYNENGDIDTIRNAEHTGILLLFEFPEAVDLEINEEKIYSIVIRLSGSI